MLETNKVEGFSFAHETCVNYAALATQRLFMASLEVILQHSKKRLPKIGKQTIVAEPAPRPLGRKIDPKNNLCATHSHGKKLARASALALKAMYGCGGALSS